MEKNQKNNSKYFLFSNEIIKTLLNELCVNFKYKKILILGLNKKEDELILRQNRHLFGFNFINKNNLELYENTDCVVLFNNAISQNNIKLCITKNVKMFLVSDYYMPFDYLSLLNHGNCINLLMRIIINSNLNNEEKTIFYCNYLMDLFSLKVHKFEDLLNSMFFNMKIDYEYDVIDNNLISFTDFNIENMIIDEQTYNLTNVLFNQIFNNIDLLSYKFLISQILINLYKNFILLIKPTLIGKFENFSFNYQKFWFVKKECETLIIKHIENLEQLAQDIKQLMAKFNVDYYYEVCKQFVGFECKLLLQNIARNYDGQSLLKIMYEMGLLNF